MILFWVICALFVVIALAFVLPPVLERSANAKPEVDEDLRLANVAVYRDQLSELESDLQNGIVSQTQFDQDREEIQRRLLEDTTPVESKTKPAPVQGNNRVTAYTLAVAIPLIAVVFYLKIGQPNSITNAAAPTNAAVPRNVSSAERSQEQIEANVAALAKRLQANPSDAQGWIMLARSYTSMEKFAEANGAYAKATELNPKDADLWAEYAFTTALTNGKKFDAKTKQLIDQALKIDPENAKALQMAGAAAFEAKDYKKAIDYWQKVLSKVPPDSEVGQAITSRIDEAKSLAGKKE